MTGTPRLSVLFVDDEESILSGLRRQFHSLRDDWEMRFVASGEAAVQAQRESLADVVVSDMRMPGMSGVELLELVRRQWPGTVRIMLSGQTDQAELLDFIGSVHQFVQKPCPPDQLRRIIARSARLAAAIEQPRLREVVAGLISLPVLPESYRSLLQALEDESSNALKVAAIIESDLGLRTKLHQMVNSSFFGIPRQITDTREAVVLLGLRSIWALAVTAHAFDAMADSNLSRAAVQSLWHTSVDLGALAAGLAQQAGRTQAEVSRARLAGTLSLIGRAVLLRHAQVEFSQARVQAAATGTPLYQMEQKHAGASQQAVGAYGLGLWAFEDSIVEAVMHAVSPEKSEVSGAGHPLAYVHVARSRLVESDLIERVELSRVFLDRVGLSELGNEQQRSAA